MKRKRETLFVVFSMKKIPITDLDADEDMRPAQLFFRASFETRKEASEWIKSEGNSWQRYMVLEAVPGGKT